MNTVEVRNTVIGEGMPKICVPIVGVTKEAILEEAKAITRLPADVVEWRIDWFENVFDFAALEDVMKDLRQVLGDLPLLMTFRTSKEGGEKAIEDEVYADINIKAAQTGYVDMVDVEIFTGDEIVRRIIEGVHAADVNGQQQDDGGSRVIERIGQGQHQDDAQGNAQAGHAANDHAQNQTAEDEQHVVNSEHLRDSPRNQCKIRHQMIPPNRPRAGSEMLKTFLNSRKMAKAETRTTM